MEFDMQLLDDYPVDVALEIAMIAATVQDEPPLVDEEVFVNKTHQNLESDLFAQEIATYLIATQWQLKRRQRILAALNRGLRIEEVASYLGTGVRSIQRILDTPVNENQHNRQVLELRLKGHTPVEIAQELNMEVRYIYSAIKRFQKVATDYELRV